MHSNTMPYKNRFGRARAFSRKFFSTFLSAILLLSLLIPALPAPAPVSAAAGPMLLYPPNGSTVTATGESGTESAPPQALPVFKWQPVEGALTYRIEFCQDANCVTPPSFTTPLTEYTPTTIGTIADGIRYWRVRVQTPAQSDFSETWYFTKQWASPQNKPTLTNPPEEEITTLEFYDAPVFSWTPVIGAAYYRFQYSTSPEFTTPTSVDTISTSYQPTAPLANSTYYWRVIPVNPANGNGTYSNIGSFVMNYNQVPVLIEPGNASTPTFTPVFRWRAVRGAREYNIQISTDPSFGSIPTNVTTKNTTFTLIAPLENDKNYYWRVRSYNGVSFSDWSNGSTPWYFMKRWYIQPVLLTPIPAFQFVRFPYFSWTPVPGAAKYRIQVSLSPDFVDNKINVLTQNTSYTPYIYDWTPGIRYWRVIPLDSNNKEGKPSNTGQYNSFEYKYSPDQVFPLYYYPPNDFPSPDTEVEMVPYEDRSVAYPLFTWQRLFDPYDGTIFPNAYRVQVGTGMNPDGTVSGELWRADTENLSAAPEAGEFNPVPGTIYYWQVTPLDGIGGNPMVRPPITVSPPVGTAPRDGTFSQVWKTRFDTAKALPATTGVVPQLLRPFYSTTFDSAVNPGYDSAEFVEITPALEWFPVAGAGQYQVEISRSTSFTTLVDSATVDYPVYAPRDAFGQRSLNHFGFGSYYWRVRAYTGGAWRDWSAPWRFQIASQSSWQFSRTIGDPSNRLEIARDTASGEVDPNFDLTGLYASQDKDYWYFGFDYFGTENSTYVLYLDVDNRNNSGATVDKFGYPLTANAAHRPEYAIYLTKMGGSFAATNTVIYQWTGSAWDSGVTLFYTGGSVFLGTNYVEIKVPFSPIGMQLTTGTYSMALVSVDPLVPAAKDTVPNNSIVSNAVTLDHITTVSEHMSLSSPANDLAGDPAEFPSSPTFFWNSPAGPPWAGYIAEVYRDAQFTTVAGTVTMTSTGPYYSPPTYAWGNDFTGDNTYYWRARPRYYLPGTTATFGSWSQAWRIERKGFVPQNLQVSITQATPTFRWDRVEGAARYTLWVSRDPTFSSKDVDVTTTENVFTPTVTLPDAKYYWKVLAMRSNNETSQWSSPLKEFTLALPQPSGLSADGKGASALVDRAPTLCWNVISVSNPAGEPVLFAYRYRVEVSKGDPNFSTLWDSIDKTTQNCWTPTKGYEDATYYWRVHMWDGSDRKGGYSPSATFTKQYPLAVPKSPVSGSQSGTTPIFRWTAADGTTPYVLGAASYRIEISTFENISTADVDQATTHSTVFTPLKKYPEGKKLYWRVAIIDKDNKWGPFTNAWIIVDEKPYDVYLPMVRR